MKTHARPAILSTHLLALLAAGLAVIFTPACQGELGEPGADLSDQEEPQGEAEGSVAVAAPQIIPPGTINTWDLMLKDDGVVVVRHFGVPILTTKSLAWAQNWAWRGFNIKVAADGRSFTGSTGELGITFVGTISNPVPERMVLDFTATNPTAVTGIAGVALELNAVLGSETFEGTPPPAPELLPGKTGVRWAVAGNQAITVRSNTALPNVYFEQGNPAKTRLVLLGPDVPAGTQNIRLIFELPAGGRKVPNPNRRYDAVDVATWKPDAIDRTTSPVDLRYLNHRPAGLHGFVEPRGEDLYFTDGTRVRFWGANVVAASLFSSDEAIATHAERLARLGYNLVRLHHHDSAWVRPNVLDRTRPDTIELDQAGVDRVHRWVHELKQRGIYVWVDLNVGRVFKAGDGIPAFAEMADSPTARGFTHLNPRLRELLKDFQHKYLTNVSPYSGVALADDPAMIGVLITNENDLTYHFGHAFLPGKGHPHHQAIFDAAKRAFSQRTGLSEVDVGLTWVPGPSKLFLNDLENSFNEDMTADLRGLGVKVPIVGTNFWGGESLFSLPALTKGGVIDVHSYGQEEALSSNAHYQGNFISAIGIASARGKPLTITEWNTPYAIADRFTAPLYVASMAAFQGWDAPMIYAYAQSDLDRAPTRPETWSSYFDPALHALAPAAALLYRQAHVRRAIDTYCLNLDRQETYFQEINPGTSAAARTTMERSAFRVCLPDVAELSWDQASVPGANVKMIEDPKLDLLAAGATGVRSDTGELERDWSRGIQVINTTRTQAAAGWIGGVPLQLNDLRVEATTKKATIVLTSLDNRPLRTSTRMLLTVVGRVVAGPAPVAYLSEPVRASLRIQNDLPALEMVPVAANGARLTPIALSKSAQGYGITLPAPEGVHWYVVRVPPTP